MILYLRKCKLYSTLLFIKKIKKKKLINQYYNKKIKLDLMDNMVDDGKLNEIKRKLK